MPRRCPGVVTLRCGNSTIAIYNRCSPLDRRTAGLGATVSQTFV